MGFYAGKNSRNKERVMYIAGCLFFSFIVFPFVNFIIPVFLCSLHVEFDVMLIFILLFSLFTGFYFGRRYAKKDNLPDSFALRYWPLLAPMVVIVAIRIWRNMNKGNAIYSNSYDTDIAIIILALCYIPFILTFAARVPLEKRLVSLKWRWQTCVFIFAMLAILGYQAELDFDNTLPQNVGAVSVADEVMVYGYWPWDKYNWITKLDEPASLIISDNYPIIDGSTSSVPIYSAVVNETYQVDSKNDLQKYMKYSRTEEAYNQLIRGEVDMIFVFQPSDGHLAAAKEAGIELHLTPIARDAFVFFVNRRNPVSDLTLEQIQDIYQKKITNWRHVGGNDKKILPFQRPQNSGSQTAMLKDVMKDKNLPPPLKAEYSGMMNETYTAIAVYRDEEESIGYSFRFYTQVMVNFKGHKRYRIIPDADPVKLLSVNGITPTVENIRSGVYPFTQDVFVVTAGTSNPHVNELIDWLLSPQGQKLIEKVGYVGVK